MVWLIINHPNLYPKKDIEKNAILKDEYENYELLFTLTDWRIGWSKRFGGVGVGGPCDLRLSTGLFMDLQDYAAFLIASVLAYRPN